MYFQLGQDKRGNPTPVVTDLGREAGLESILDTHLLSIPYTDKSGAVALVRLLNQAVKTGFDVGFDGGYANGVGAGRRLERSGK